MPDGATAPVVVAVVTSRFEAELIVGFLEDNGLRAALSADDAGGQEPQLQLQGVSVLVDRADEASARRLLAAADPQGATPGRRRPPRPTIATSARSASAARHRSVAHAFDLQDWRAAMQLSLTGRAGGKLLLLP